MLMQTTRPKYLTSPFPQVRNIVLSDIFRARTVLQPRGTPPAASQAENPSKSGKKVIIVDRLDDLTIITLAIRI
jgi:hypothetical protein